MEQQYLFQLSRLAWLAKYGGGPRGDRTGTGTFSVFGRQIRTSLKRGFPLLTTKKVHLRSVIHELLWFLNGDTNIGYLNENGVRIWDEWADENGDLGPVYGAQWRSWGTRDGECIDQMANVVRLIERDPGSRRLIVSAWNVGELHEMRLSPCHCLFQFYVSDGTLSCQLYQRSADIFLGVPFNIASYALLTMMVAKVTGLEPGELIISFGDLHLYKNHVEQAEEQLSRSRYSPPQMLIKRVPKSLFDYRPDDFELVNYQHHPPIKAEVSV